ncbi:hypothetical protein [uncultured Kordia sp.]|uniref:hypothetical protein n=1 Tax=uncultured Kordia sp. TaxID=507699 RepID=UPI00262F1EF9|nr:hypothetical protein [uncultured Kordia sp.]
MKKQLFFLTVIFTTVLTIVCCTSIRIDACDNCSDGTIQNRNTSRSLLASSCEDPIYMNYNDESINRMPAQIVSDMIFGYQDKQLKIINSGIDTDDTKAIWFDLETLKKFIYNIEKLSKCNGNIPEEELGVRIYYAIYPKTEGCTYKGSNNDNQFRFNYNWDMNIDRSIENSNSIEEDHLNRHTLVMIPTKKNDIGEHIDFNPYNTTSNREGLDYLFEDTDRCNEGILSLTVFPQNEGSENPNAQNHGGLFPPRGEKGMAFKK